MAQSDAQRTGPDTARPPRATRREWIGLAVIALPCLLYAMDLTVLTLAIPALSADLAPSSTELLWIVDIYGFLVAGFLIPMGTLGDRIGRRRLLMIGAGAFGAASVLAAFSTSAEMLIATGSVFLVGVPVMVLLLAVAPSLLPEFRDPEAGRPDLASAALSLAAVLAVIYGLKQAAQDGPSWQAALAV